MLSPTEVDRARTERGEEIKRVLRAAAALQGIYTDRDLADALEVSERTVYGWWDGSVPGAANIERLATFTGLPRRDLMDWLQYGSEPPVLEAAFVQAQDGMLSLHPTDDVPDTRAGSSRTRPGHPNRRRDDNV